MTGEASIAFETEAEYGDGWLVADQSGSLLNAADYESLVQNGADIGYIRALKIYVYDESLDIHANVTGLVLTPHEGEQAPIFNPQTMTLENLDPSKRITSFSVEFAGYLVDDIQLNEQNAHLFEVGYNPRTQKTVVIFVASAEFMYITTDGTFDIGEYLKDDNLLLPVYGALTYETTADEDWLDNEYEYTGSENDRLAIGRVISTDTDMTAPTPTPFIPTPTPTVEPTPTPTVEPTPTPTVPPTPVPEYVVSAEMAIYDESGHNTGEEVTIDNIGRAAITVQNNSGQTLFTDVYLAFYRDDGTLVSAAKPDSITSVSSDGKTYVVPINCPDAQVPEDAAYAMVYLWKTDVVINGDTVESIIRTLEPVCVPFRITN